MSVVQTLPLGRCYFSVDSEMVKNIRISDTLHTAWFGGKKLHTMEKCSRKGSVLWLQLLLIPLGDIISEQNAYSTDLWG